MSWRHGRSLNHQSLTKQHFPTFQKYQLVYCIHCVKPTKEKYFHVVIMYTDNVDWVILIILKSLQVSPSMHLQILLNLFVDTTIVYFLIKKEMYFLLDLMPMTRIILVGGKDFTSNGTIKLQQIYLFF